MDPCSRPTLLAPPPLVSPGAEPIPGYRLLERLGTGGYGEVWKAIAPGGLAKAVKIIYGGLSGPRAEQELRALERIKSVRHPFLLSLERFEVAAGQLVIVTELADRSLMQRFLECRQAGLPGIPRRELLGYLREAADALDYLNETHGLQHLDIKPENLLLVGNHVKVGDFGLVKNLVGSSASITGGLTPIYATPEAFDGRASRYSDQYSLAIVYQEMLTGERPFPGTTALHLMTQHTSTPPRLDPLPPGDRPVVGRALAKIPENRFPRCGQFIEGLLKVRLDADTAPPPAPPPRRHDGGARTVVGGGRSPSRVHATVAATKQPTEDPAFLDRGNRHSNEPKATPQPVVLLAEAPGAKRPQLPGEAGLATLGRTLPAVVPGQLGGGYRPTLYVGLGGLAGRALRGIKHRLGEAFAQRGGVERLPCVFRFLHLDTDRASFHGPPQGPPDLAGEELLHCPLRQPEEYREHAHGLLRWLPRRWLYGIPRSLRTEGLRPLGRLAFVDHADAVLAALRAHLGHFLTSEARAAAAAAGLRGEWPRVVVVAAITGGTGGGMLIDAAWAAHQVFADLHLPAEVWGVLLYASGSRAEDRARARINAHATLQELWHWSRADAAGADAPAVQGAGGISLPTQWKMPFADCYVLGHPGEGDGAGDSASADAIAQQATEYLWFDASAGGACLERLRARSRAARMTVRACGTATVRFPRGRLIEAAAASLCRQVVEGWRGELPAVESRRLAQVAVDWARQQGLGEERLRERLLGRLRGLLTPAAATLYEQLSDGRTPPHPPRSEVFARLLALLDAEFGAGPEADGDPPAGQAPVEEALRREAGKLAAALGQESIDRLRELVETPGARLRGAEVGLGAITRYLADEIQNIRNGLDKVGVARRLQRRRFVGHDSKTCGLLPGKVRRLFQEAPAVDRPLWNYFCLRVEELLADAALAALVEVQRRLSDWGQDLYQARRNLASFLADLPAQEAIPAACAGDDAPCSDQLELWPGDAADLRSARKELLQGLPDGLYQGLDERIQEEILRNTGGLLAVLQGLDNGPISGLVGRLTAQAAAALEAYLQGTDLTRVLCQRHGEGLAQAIGQRIAAARQQLAVQGPWEHLVLALPAGAEAVAVREAARAAAGAAPLTLLEPAVDSSDCLVAVWETAGLSLAELGERFAGADPGIVELAQKVRTRKDVAWSGF